MARGSTVRATIEFIRREYGDAVLGPILGRLGDEERRQLIAADPTDDLPYEAVLALWRVADDALGSARPSWMEAAGAFAIRSLGQQLYGGLLRKASPAEFVSQSVSLFRLYYSPGDMELVEAEPGRAVLRLVGFDSLSPLFCRRQTGGLACATELAGGKEARVRHVRCVHEGDAYCEWEMRWSS
jgi:hypothetical protein